MDPLFADDEKGWGAVMCVRHKEGVYFSQANGQKSKGEALQAAKIGADRFIKERGGDGIFIPLCAPAWNNDGQKVAFGGDGVPEWQEHHHEDPRVVDHAKAAIRSGLKPQDRNYQRDCVRPEPAPSAEAKLKPIGSTSAPYRHLPPSKPAVSSDAWKPAPWCPPTRPNNGGGGVRG